MYKLDDVNYILQKTQTYMKYGVWRSNTDLDELYLSKELCSVLHVEYLSSYDLTFIENIVYIEDINKIYTLFEDATTLGIGFETTFRSEIEGELKYFSLYCDVKYTDNTIEYLYGFIQDITTASIEKEKKDKLSHLTDKHIIISQTDLYGRITYVSQAFVEISGYSVSELVGANQNIVRHPDMPSSLFKGLWKSIQAGDNWEGEILNLKKDGGIYWVYSYITPLRNFKNEIIGYQSIRQDITDKKKLEEIAITDGLTSLYNRRHFDFTLSKEISHSQRSNTRVIFAMLDVDNFKKYNDRYGHQEGDKVLKAIASTLREGFRRMNDMVFRLGGEEFGILFSLEEDEDIFSLVDRARQSIENLRLEHIENEAGVVTASFGVIEFVSDFNNKISDEVDFVYKAADKMLYKAKHSGRNRVCIETI